MIERAKREHTFTWALAIERPGRDYRMPLFSSLRPPIEPPPGPADMQLTESGVRFLIPMYITGIAFSRPDLVLDVSRDGERFGEFSGPWHVNPNHPTLAEAIRVPVRQLLSVGAFLLPGNGPAVVHVWLRTLFCWEIQ